MVGDKRRNNMKWDDLKAVYEDKWLPYFGKPTRVKIDPEGAWMDSEAAEYFGRDGALLEPIPGQAHWQISIAEEAIQATKSIMTALALEFPEISAEEALARATAAGNSREDIRGYSPIQHALGRAPDLDGRFYEAEFDSLPTVEAEKVDKTFGESYARMQSAEVNHLKWMYQRRVSRAENTKNRKAQLFVLGTYVCYWRLEPHKGDGRGSYKGIARVLCQETGQEASVEGSQQVAGQVGEVKAAPCVCVCVCVDYPGWPVVAV
jgi:hypothetical protein